MLANENASKLWAPITVPTQLIIQTKSWWSIAVPLLLGVIALVPELVQFVPQVGHKLLNVGLLHLLQPLYLALQPRDHGGGVA